MVVEVDKPTSIIDKSDEAAIASLENHPGAIALLNRLRLQRALLETQLLTTHFKDLRDADFVQSRIAGLGYVESQIRSATKNLSDKKTRLATATEVEEFQKVLSSIESIRTTNPEES